MLAQPNHHRSSLTRMRLWRRGYSSTSYRPVLCCRLCFPCGLFNAHQSALMFESLNNKCSNSFSRYIVLAQASYFRATDVEIGSLKRTFRYVVHVTLVVDSKWKHQAALLLFPSGQYMPSRGSHELTVCRVHSCFLYHAAPLCSMSLSWTKVISITLDWFTSSLFWFSAHWIESAWLCFYLGNFIWKTCNPVIKVAGTVVGS